MEQQNNNQIPDEQGYENNALIATSDLELPIRSSLKGSSNSLQDRGQPSIPPTGSELTGHGALFPFPIPSTTPGNTPRDDSPNPITTNGTTPRDHLSLISLGNHEQLPCQPQDDFSRERLKSDGGISPSADSQQPLDSPQEEGEKVSFKDLTCPAKIFYVLKTAAKPISVIILLYFFICSLTLLSSAFILIGGRMAGDAFGNNPLLSNPVCGLMIGVVSTAFLQSSSTSTSIVVTMVSSKILSVRLAIPIIMGSNIGTSVTGIFVAVTQAGQRSQFEKAFSAATVHDMFNWLTVITLLPLEIATGYLYHLTSAIVASVAMSSGGSKQQFLSVLTDPFTNLIVQVDKDALEKIAAGESGSEELSLLKYWCETKSIPANTTKDMILNRPPGRYIFHGTSLSEPAVGILVLIIALVLLITCLVLMVKLLKSLLQSSMAKAIQKTIGADFPGRAACFTGYVALLVGAFVTVLVQSSSVVASVLTPLVGLGVVTVERVYPMMLGANIGTTSTAILAAFAASGDRFKASFQVAMCHLFFNLSGILMWYPIPFMRAVPIKLAKFLGQTTARYRWFAFVYIFSMFFALPLIVFALSIPGWPVLLGVASPFIVLLFFVIIINFLQKYKPLWLPEKMRTWDFLPECLRSLAPLDRKMTQMMNCCTCCKCCQTCVQPEEEVLAISPEAQVTASNGDFSDFYGVSSTDALLSQSPSNASDNNSTLLVPRDGIQCNQPSNFESAV